MGILDILSGLYGAGKATMDAAGAPRPGNQQAASNRQGSFLDFLPELLTQDMQTQGGKVRDPAARAKQFGPQGIDWVLANGPERESVKARQAALDASIGPDPRYGAVEMTPENTKWAEEQLRGADATDSNRLTRDVGGGVRVAMGRDGQPVGYSTDPLSLYEPLPVVTDGSPMVNGQPKDGFLPAERQRLQADIQNAANWGLQQPAGAQPKAAPAVQSSGSMMAQQPQAESFLPQFDSPLPDDRPSKMSEQRRSEMLQRPSRPDSQAAANQFDQLSPEQWDIISKLMAPSGAPLTGAAYGLADLYPGNDNAYLARNLPSELTGTAPSNGSALFGTPTTPLSDDKITALVEEYKRRFGFRPVLQAPAAPVTVNSSSVF